MGDVEALGLGEYVPFLEWLSLEAGNGRLVVNGKKVAQVWVQLAFDGHEPLLQFVNDDWEPIRWMSILEARVAFGEQLEGTGI